MSESSTAVASPQSPPDNGCPPPLSGGHQRPQFPPVRRTPLDPDVADALNDVQGDLNGGLVPVLRRTAGAERADLLDAVAAEHLRAAILCVHAASEERRAYGG